MNKVIITMISIIVVITAIMVGSNIYKENETAKQNQINQEQTQIAQTNVTEEILDDCTDEWESNNNQEKETLQVNSNYEKEEKYILREKDDKIIAYKIDENGEEIEYLATDISTDYLAEDDKQNLQKRNDS